MTRNRLELDRENWAVHLTEGSRFVPEAGYMIGDTEPLEIDDIPSVLRAEEEARHAEVRAMLEGYRKEIGR